MGVSALSIPPIIIRRINSSTIFITWCWAIWLTWFPVCVGYRISRTFIGKLSFASAIIDANPKISCNVRPYIRHFLSRTRLCQFCGGSQLRLAILNCVIIVVPGCFIIIAFAIGTENVAQMLKPCLTSAKSSNHFLKAKECLLLSQTFKINSSPSANCWSFRQENLVSDH